MVNLKVKVQIKDSQTKDLKRLLHLYYSLLAFRTYFTSFETYFVCIELFLFCKDSFFVIIKF